MLTDKGAAVLEVFLTGAALLAIFAVLRKTGLINGAKQLP